MLFGKFLRTSCKMLTLSSIRPFFDSDFAFNREFSIDNGFMNIAYNLNCW